MRDHAHTLSDFLVPSLSIECEPCGRRGRYNVARLMEKYGDAKLPELRHVLANCPKARSQSIHDRCKVRYGEDSRLSCFAPRRRERLAWRRNCIAFTRGFEADGASLEGF
jgi:hypothetical protein